MKESHVNSNRKKLPTSNEGTPEKEEGPRGRMDVEPSPSNSSNNKVLKFSQLNDEVKFYLTEIYPFPQNRLFMTGKMENGQTINIVANQPLRDLFFSLRREYSDTDELSEGFKNKAIKEIKQALYNIGVKDFHGEFIEKRYVFELEGVHREKRPYYRVRYPFDKDFSKDKKEDVRPDWEGETFKYVFGTSYTPLELAILNG